MPDQAYYDLLDNYGVDLGSDECNCAPCLRSRRDQGRMRPTPRPHFDVGQVVRVVGPSPARHQPAPGDVLEDWDQSTLGYVAEVAGRNTDWYLLYIDGSPRLFYVTWLDHGDGDSPWGAVHTYAGGGGRFVTEFRQVARCTLEADPAFGDYWGFRRLYIAAHRKRGLDRVDRTTFSAMTDRMPRRWVKAVPPALRDAADRVTRRFADADDLERLMDYHSLAAAARLI